MRIFFFSMTGTNTRRMVGAADLEEAAIILKELGLNLDQWRYCGDIPPDRKMIKYYFKVDDYYNTLEKCKIRAVGIGSITCQQCMHCAAVDTAPIPSWIECRRLEEATGQSKIEKDQND
jgi:hypothetical protein